MRRDAAAEHGARATDLAAERDTLAAELTTLRKAIAERDTHATHLAGERDALSAELAAVRAEADSHAAQAVTDRDALAKELNTLRNSAAERDGLAKDLAAERDVLARDLSAARDAAHAQEQQLHTAAERIRALELQLFQRDSGAGDQDVELDALLDQPSEPQSSEARPARHQFASPIEIRIDGKVGLLVNLSTSGAQVLSQKALAENRVVKLVLPGDEAPIECRGSVVWTGVEPGAAGRPRVYRAGISFIGADAAAITAFNRRHAAG
jgi:chorismate mutase